MKRLLAVCLMSFALGGCAGAWQNLATNPTVVSVVDGVRTACGWEAASSDVQSLMNSGIPGLSTIQNYVGAICAAVANLPVASVRGGAATTLTVAGVPMRATRAVK